MSLLLVYSLITVAHQCQVLSMVYSAGEGVAIDVDRFDPGRLGKPEEGVVPTAVIPGDIAIPCQVWLPTSKVFCLYLDHLARFSCLL